MKRNLVNVERNLSVAMTGRLRTISKDKGWSYRFDPRRELVRRISEEVKFFLLY